MPQQARPTPWPHCRIVPVLFSGLMDPERLSAILLNAPIWARLALTVPNPHLPERAADALATIVRKLEEPTPETDRNQLALPL